MPPELPLWKRKLRWLEIVFKFGLRYLLLSFSRSHWEKPASPEVSIENTSVCNARCIFCANGMMQRPRKAMDAAVFKKTVDEAVQLGSSMINFSVMIGDPLLDRQLLERVRYVKSFHGVRETGFTTTLQWLHLFDLDEFFASGIDWIVVSTTLSGSQTYREFFGVDKYDQMLSNLVRLLEENNRRNRPIDIQLSIKPTPEPRESILRHPDFQHVQSLMGQDLRKLVKREGFFVMDWGGSVRMPPYLRLHPLWPRKRRPCARILRNLMVYSNGKVGACNCVDFEGNSELILGNIGEKSLSEMWNGGHLEQIRSDWQSGRRIPSVCETCRMYRP